MVRRSGWKIFENSKRISDGKTQSSNPTRTFRKKLQGEIFPLFII